MNFTFRGWESRTMPFDIYQSGTSSKATDEGLPFENMDCLTVENTVKIIIKMVILLYLLNFILWGYEKDHV